MNYALVGNNDGPLRLIKALKKEGVKLPDFVGLQKKPHETLLVEYLQETVNIDFNTGFKEDGLIEL